MDEGDPKKDKKIKREKGENTSIQRYISNACDVFSPLRLRRSIQIDNGYEWFILGSRCGFLFNFRMFLVILYLAYEAFK